MTKRPLLIFGLRGTLLERLHTSKLPSATPNADFSVGLHKIWIRPKMMETLTELSRSCDLAIWSSTTARNTTPMMESVFDASSLKFRFVWTREHTTSDDFRRLMSSQHEDDYATLKDLTVVQKAFPEYGLDRMALIDDTPSKGRLQADNFVWLPTFTVDQRLKNDEFEPGVNNMVRLQQLVEGQLLPATDFRKVLPARL